MTTRKSDLPLDADLVRALAALLDETGLSEIEYAVADKRIRVARNAPTSPAIAVNVPQQVAAPTAITAPAADHPGAVKSPMVGTLHVSPQPKAPPFVQVGDTVREGQTLFIIEAMKVMNQIPAPRAGRVAEILVADGTPVEFGQLLAVLE